MARWCSLARGWVLPLGLIALPAAPSLGDESAIPPHLVAAEQLVAHVRPADSSYQHHHGTVTWQGSDGAAKYECHTDCSGLLNHLLEHVYGLKDRDLRAWLGTGRPTARTFHRAIAENNGFRHVERVDQVRPGDILAVEYPPEEKDTGHVMIVAHAPRQRAATAPLVPATQQWEVAIIDSASSGHGKADTRLKPDGTYNSGVGQGIARLYTDGQGNLSGYTWSTSKSSRFYDPRSRHMVIGRLEPPTEGPKRKSAPSP